MRKGGLLETKEIKRERNSLRVLLVCYKKIPQWQLWLHVENFPFKPFAIFAIKRKFF